MGNLRVISHTDSQVLGLADYVWCLDGKMHSKTRTIPVTVDQDGNYFPILEKWKAWYPKPENPRELNQIILHPAHYVPDPLRPQPSYVVLCETRDITDYPLETNTRAQVRKDLEHIQHLELWWGCQQDYTIEPHDPERDIEIYEQHIRTCVDAGLMLHSAEIKERCRRFKVGPRRVPPEIDDEPNALVVADHLWLARYFLHRLAQKEGRRLCYPLGTQFALYLSTVNMRKSADGISEVKGRLEQGGSHYTTECLSVVYRWHSHLKQIWVSAVDPYKAIHTNLKVLGEHNG